MVLVTTSYTEVLNTSVLSSSSTLSTRSNPLNLICHLHCIVISSVQSLSRVWFSVTPWTAARQASLSITNSQSLLKLLSIESVMPSNHLILCHPLLLPSIFPSIKVFSNESALRIRWPKYWSFSFNISPSNEHLGLIFFRMDWLDLLEVQRNQRSNCQYRWIIKEAREFQKNIYFCFIDYANAFDCVDHNCGKFWKRWECQTT